MKKLLCASVALALLLCGCQSGGHVPSEHSTLALASAVESAPSEGNVSKSEPTPEPVSSEPSIVESTVEAEKTPLESAVDAVSAKYKWDERLVSGKVYGWMGKLKVEMSFSQDVGVNGFPGVVEEVTDTIWQICEDNEIICIDINLTVWANDRDRLTWHSNIETDADNNDHLLFGFVTDGRDGYETFNNVSAYEVADVIVSDEEIQAKKDAEAAIPYEYKSALNKANQYLNYMAFSYSGLIGQLEYEGYSTEAATYAVDNCGADWNEQAVEKAQDYLDYTSFSYDGLVSQLEFEGFTHDQAVYAADQTYQ